MSYGTVTRGSGLLEGWLSKLRTKRANALIKAESRNGAVLDIGCGLYPYFLLHTDFQSKFGIDQNINLAYTEELRVKNISLSAHDVALGGKLPFADASFNVVSMLAVFEHIAPAMLPNLIGEVHRVLKPGGLYVLTTPAPHANIVLKLMEIFHLISAEEVEEHKDLYNHEKIIEFITRAGFARAKVSAGSFELGLNLWVTVEK